MLTAVIILPAWLLVDKQANTKVKIHSMPANAFEVTKFNYQQMMLIQTQNIEQKNRLNHTLTPDISSQKNKYHLF